VISGYDEYLNKDISGAMISNVLIKIGDNWIKTNSGWLVCILREIK